MSKKKNGGNGHRQLSGAALKILNSITEDVREGVSTFERACAAVSDNQIFPQDLMEGELLIDRIKDLCKDGDKAFTKSALKHHKSKGQFEHGRIAFNVKVTTRRNASWKDEAIANARKLAEMRGEDFDEEEYVNSVMESAKVSTSEKPTLTESE